MNINTASSEFLNGLVGTAFFAPYSEIVDEWANQGEGTLLYEIAVTLDAEGAAMGVPESSVRGIVDHIVDRLALLPQPGFPEFASRLVVNLPQQQPAQPGYSTLARHRSVAQKLARTSGNLMELFAVHGDDSAYREYLACLLHEMVLHGKVDALAMPIVHFQERLKLQNHPLAKLPCRLLDSERLLPNYLQRFRMNGFSWGMLFGLQTDNPTNTQVKGSPLPDEERATADPFSSASMGPVILKSASPSAAASQIPAAIMNWVAESNGQYEAREIIASRPLTQQQVTDELLLSCPLDCLSGAAPPNLCLQSVPPSEVMEILFSAAANGGAYDRGLCGAYGRLKAWESLAGLSGCQFDSAEAVEVHANQCRGWWTFEASAEWFHYVAWDIGVMALRSQGDTLAILAATDTD